MPETNRRIQDIAGSLANVARAAARGAVSAGNDKLVASILLTTPLLGGELQKPVECASAPQRLTEPGELVRVNFDLDGIVASQNDLALLLVREIEPFIIGVGQVEVRLTTKGVVVRRTDSRVIDDRH